MSQVAQHFPECERLHNLLIPASILCADVNTTLVKLVSYAVADLVIRRKCAKE